MLPDNPILHWLAEAGSEQLQDWLRNYLHGRDVIPALPVPHTHRSRANYLADFLSRSDSIEAKRSGDAVLALLRDWAEHAAQTGGSGSTPEAVWALTLLTLLQTLPVTEPAAAVSLLDRLRQEGRWKEWPSATEDVHRQTLLALANQLRAHPTAMESLQKRLIEEEFPDGRYAGPAWVALSTGSPQTAARYVPRIAQTLHARGGKSDNLLLILSRRAGSDSEVWVELGRALADQEDVNLIKSVKNAASKVLTSRQFQTFDSALTKGLLRKGA